MKLKRIGILLSATVLSVMTNITVLAKNAEDYRDVKPDDWFYEYVADVSSKEFMTGYADRNFGPTKNLTRGELATVIYRMHETPAVAYEARFPDVKSNVYYSVPVTWANTYGVITGYNSGNFGPNDNITREQLAAMLYRYAVRLGYATSESGDLNKFPDGGRVTDFAKEAMMWAIGAGIITGDSGNLKPQGTVSRAVGATMISRFTNLVGGSKHVHTWVAHTETKVVKEAYEEPIYEEQPVYTEEPVYETVPVYTEQPIYDAAYVCNQCSDFLQGTYYFLPKPEELGGMGLFDWMMRNGHFGHGFSYKYVQVGTEKIQTGTEQVQVGVNKVQTGTQKVQTGTVHHDAVTETVTIHTCSCGATK